MSETSLSLLVKHLSESQVRDVCKDLVNKVLSNKSDDNEYLSQLCELLKVVPKQVGGEFYQELLEFARNLVSNLNDLTRETSFSSITLLSEQYPSMSEDLIQFSISKIEAFYTTNKLSLEKSLIQVSDIQINDASNVVVEAEEVKHSFKFLETLFLSSDIFHVNDEVDSLCYAFLGSNDEEISIAALKVLKWRLDSICQSQYTISKLWKVIFVLMNLESKVCRTNGYILWLKFFKKMQVENLSSNDDFQKLISSAEYWIYLKKGLVSSTHEHKKYSLTLIQLTLQVVSVDIDNSDMMWVEAEHDKYVSAWKRFCTLYEITGIDTSVNQTLAAFPDLNSLFAPSSLIPVGFSLCILAIGFSNALDSIRKLFLQFVFSLDKESLHVFKHGGAFLEDVFLPFAILAKNYKVVKTIDDVYECEFGSKLQAFVTNCILQLNTTDEISAFSEIILNVLSKYKLAFDPAKIYLGFGLLNGLQRKNIKGLNNKHLELLCSLMTSHSEGDVFDTTLQTIYLRLVLYTDVECCNLHSLFHALGSFVTNNDYEIYIDNEEFFIDFITENYQQDDLLSFFNDNFQFLEVETLIPLISLILSVCGPRYCTTISAQLLSHPSVNLLLVTMLHSKIDFNNLFTESLIVSKLERLIDDLLTGSTDYEFEVYARSSELVDSKVLFNDDFWMSIDLKDLFDNLSNKLSTLTSVDKLGYSIGQFKFFTECFKKCIYNEDFPLKIEDMIDLSKTAFTKQDKADTAIGFYKQKDELYGLIATCCTELLKITPISPEINTQILDLCEDLAAFVDYNCPFACVKLMTDLIEVNGNGKQITLATAHRIVDNLQTTYTELTADRLVLSHRLLHQNFIKLLMSKTLLSYSSEDEELGDKIFKIADDFISQSYFRKALLPILFNCISDYQLEANEFFEKSIWISKLLVHGNHLVQTDHNLFKLDIIISNDIFNKYLNMTGVDLYEKVYDALEISYKVSIAVISASIKSTEFAKQLWETILTDDKEYHMNEILKPKDAAEQGKRIQLLELMMLTIKSLSSELLLYYLKNYILKTIFKEPSPLCRMYMEWMIAYCIYTLPSSKDEIFDFFLDGVLNQKPSVVTMFERISYLVAHQLNNVEEAKELTEFVSKYLIPAATSNRAVNRHFSVSLICSVYPEIVRKDLKLPIELIDALKGIYKQAEGADGFGKHRHGDALLWNIVDDLTLVGICGGVLLKVSDREVDVIRDYVFHKYTPKGYYESNNYLQVPIGTDEVNKWIQGERSSEIISDKFLATDIKKNLDPAESSLLQIKSGAWSTVLEELDDDESNDKQAGNGEGSEDIRVAVKRSPLIVVSSLVDKAPNLGGICRLCDVLGAGWMTMNDIKMKEDFQFQAVAVTADRWMPIIEVKIEQITEFMRMKKREGYTLIGLEQTDKSVELNSDLKFPEKSLILLGKEKEGIPGELLAELDMCVIIKQVGIIRSMNIQTATAVIVHAYSSQHC